MGGKMHGPKEPVNAMLKVRLPLILCGCLGLFYLLTYIDSSVPHVQPARSEASDQYQPISEDLPPITGDYRILTVYPHDPTSFTQGLVYHDGFLYESTGLYGQSLLRKLDVSGKVFQEKKLDQKLFGEGLVQHGRTLVQLTWKEGVAIVYDIDTFEEIKRFNYEGQGWGITFDGTHFIMSDGSSKLFYRDPETFEVVREVTVQDSSGHISQINELEFCKGHILANVWFKDIILRIDVDGNVVRKYDFADLRPNRKKGEDVFNGIAVDTTRNNTLWVTGKKWHNVYRIEIPW